MSLVNLRTDSCEPLVQVTLGQARWDEIVSLLFPPEGLQAGMAWLQRIFGQPGCCEGIPNAQLKIFHHLAHAFLFQYPNRVADRVNTSCSRPTSRRGRGALQRIHDASFKSFVHATDGLRQRTYRGDGS